jgi:PPM family protein phosphatase
MAMCPKCTEPVADGDLFCEACGTDLRTRRGGTALAEVNADPCRRCGEPAPTSATGAGTEYCPACGLRRQDGTDRVETDLGAIGGVSDRGLVHARNEDAMALGLRLPAGSAAVLCDGVSSVRSPELASRAATETALGVLLSDPGQPPGDGRAQTASRSAAVAGARLVRAAVAEAAAAVAALGAPGDHDAPSCTLVCAHLDYPDGAGADPVITVGWVGDSRAYWLAAQGASEPSQRLTTDHSWATAMVDSGKLDEATAFADRRAHAITRWLGQGGEPEPEVLSWRPEGPGVLLLCSDGLWNYLPGAEELAAALPPPEHGASPVEVARLLTRIALDAGGRDNITVIVIPVRTGVEVRV